VKPCARCSALPTRLHMCGPCCPNCTPAALAGHAEPGRTASDYTPQPCPLPIPSGRRVRLIAVDVTTLHPEAS
jgi:hypothetical protein